MARRKKQPLDLRTPSLYARMASMMRSVEPRESPRSLNN